MALRAKIISNHTSCMHTNFRTLYSKMGGQMTATDVFHQYELLIFIRAKAVGHHSGASVKGTVA